MLVLCDEAGTKFYTQTLSISSPTWRHIKEERD